MQDDKMYFIDGVQVSADAFLAYEKHKIARGLGNSRIGKSHKLVNRAMASMIDLTTEMIIKGDPFGEDISTRPTSKELGQALVKANKYGLRLVKGNK